MNSTGNLSQPNNIKPQSYNLIFVFSLQLLINIFYRTITPMTINYKIYCLNYDSPKRREDMQERFNKLNISPDNCVFYPGVSPDDPRISGQPFTRDHEHYKRVWSMAWGHLDMISLFLNDTSVSHGIFCEDDIYIHKYFSQFIYDTIIDFEKKFWDPAVELSI